MSKKFRLLMALVLITGLFGGLLTSSTVSADPDTGTWIEIPRIDKGTVFGQTWDTTIQIQNTSTTTGSWVVVDFWPGWTQTCPPSSDTHVGHAEMWVPAGGVWSLHNAIPAGAESAFVFSCAADSTSAPPGHPCATALGPPLAVTVDRWGPDPFGGVALSSSYTGIADPAMVGPGPAYEYYAPYVMYDYNNLDTTITIQNSGAICASIWIYYKEEANCEMQQAQHIEQIRPGESIRIGPGADADMAFPSPGLTSPWLGSAYVTANVPLAIVVDQLTLTSQYNQGTLLSMRGMPFDQGEGEDKWYADLLYREISGYTSAIQVQNLTQDSQPTFVTVDFFDQSGDEILFVGDWICRNAAATFYLPAIVDLGINFPFGYVGAAEIQSSAQVDYPGGDHAGEPIFAVVDIKKTKVWDGDEWRHTVAGETQGGAYNAHPEHQKENAWSWAMPFIAKERDGVTSRIAIRNNSNCNKINGQIQIKDETGRTVAYIPVPYLHPKHMKVFDLNYFGQIYPGFLGAAVYTVGDVEQLCDTNGDGETDILPVMPSAVVLNYGYAAELDPFNPVPTSMLPQTTEGDLTRVYEAIPFNTLWSPCIVTFSGHVIDEETLEPVNTATVSVGTATDTTDSAGHYEINYVRNPRATETEAVTLQVVKSGYATWTSAMTITCDDVVTNPELDPSCSTVSLSGTVEDKETGLWIEGATVTATNAKGNKTATTDANGAYSITDLPFDVDDVTIVNVTATGYNPAVDSVYYATCGDAASISFQLHDDPMSRILLYTGNGGEAMLADDACDPTDLVTTHVYCAAEILFEYFGYQVDYQNTWPTDPDLEEYKVIFLLGPGNDETDEDETEYFTPGQIAQLDLFMRNGGRLVVMGDSGDQVEVENILLGALNDIDVLFVADGTYNPTTVTGALADKLGTPDQLLGDTFPTSTNAQDVNTLDFGVAISVTVDVGEADPGRIAQVQSPHPSAEATICAADQMAGVTRLKAAGYAGDVVVIGDLDWMDDASFMGTITYSQGTPDYVWPDWPADNENLLLNLFTF